MDNTLISVLAASSASVIGATTPVIGNFVIQRSAAQRELTNREIAQREELYLTRERLNRTHHRLSWDREAIVFDGKTRLERARAMAR